MVSSAQKHHRVSGRRRLHGRFVRSLPGRGRVEKMLKIKRLQEKSDRTGRLSTSWATRRKAGE